MVVGQGKIVRRWYYFPVGWCFQMKSAACASAGRGDFHYHRASGAWGKQREVFGEVEGNGRDHFQTLANLAFHTVTDYLYGFARDDQRLAVDFEDILHWKRRRILGTADE